MGLQITETAMTSDNTRHRAEQRVVYGPRRDHWVEIELDADQLAGWACVVCGKAITGPPFAEAIGRVGGDLVYTHTDFQGEQCRREFWTRVDAMSEPGGRHLSGRPRARLQ